MAYTVMDAGKDCYAVYDGDRLVARIVPHRSGFGWRAVSPDLAEKDLTTQRYETPELALKYLPAGL